MNRYIIAPSASKDLNEIIDYFADLNISPVGCVRRLPEITFELSNMRLRRNAPLSNLMQ